jgi:hypothetical protein
MDRTKKVENISTFYYPANNVAGSNRNQKSLPGTSKLSEGRAQGGGGGGGGGGGAMLT